MGKLLEFKPREKEFKKNHRPEPAEDDEPVRFDRIKRSLERINKLMADLKQMADEGAADGANNAKVLGRERNQYRTIP